jgi:hypothetical protein
LRRIALALVVLWCLGDRVAAADDAAQQASSANEKAVAAFGLGNYARAAEQYEVAFRLKPDAPLLYNAAEAHRLAGNQRRALDLYRNFVFLYGAVSPLAPDAKKHVAELEAMLAAETSPAPAAYPPPAAPVPGAPPTWPPVAPAPAPVAAAAPPGWPAPAPTRAPNPHRRRLVALPYVGINSYQGDSGKGVDPGLHIGALLGGRIGRIFSINGELTFDFLNLSNTAPDASSFSLDIDLAVSPLFHIPVKRVELVVGPKLGLELNVRSFTQADMTSTGRSLGTVFGLNTGAFVSVSRGVALGGMLSLVVRRDAENCNTPPNSSEQCTTDITYSSAKVLGVSFGALF